MILNLWGKKKSNSVWFKKINLSNLAKSTFKGELIPILLLWCVNAWLKRETVFSEWKVELNKYGPKMNHIMF